VTLPIVLRDAQGAPHESCIMHNDVTSIALAEAALGPRDHAPAVPGLLPGERVTRRSMLDTQDGLVSVTAQAWRLAWPRP
jgi:hypothetical protein